jgi:hypothetical protein
MIEFYEGPCEHPKDARRLEDDDEVQVCNRCGAYRLFNDVPLIAAIVGRWGCWRAGTSPCRNSHSTNTPGGPNRG